MIRLVIEKMSKGGFVVYDGDGLGQGGHCAALHAATDIADALAFIGDNLAPVEKAHADKAAYCPVCKCTEFAFVGKCGERECPRPDDPACKVCGSLHSDAYCARQTCPGSQRKLYEPAADGSVNWAG